MNQHVHLLRLPMHAEQLCKLIPHRYPFLLVDRVTALEPDQNIITLKNVTINEPFFTGHFPDHPVMPGVLLIEAMAQSTGLLSIISAELKDMDIKNSLFYLVKVNNARFNIPVIPGDQILMEIRLKRQRGNMIVSDARALVDTREVASCELICAARTQP